MGSCMAKTPSHQLDSKLWKRMNSYTVIHRCVKEYLKNHPSPPSSILFDTPSALMLEKEFKRFIYLISYCLNHSDSRLYQRTIQPSQIVPSPIIDRIWCCFLIRHDSYSQFCSQIVGSFVSRSQEAVSNFENYQLTLQLYAQLFQEPKAAVWPNFNNEEEWRRSTQGYVRIISRDFRTFSKYFIQSVRKKNQNKLGQLHTRVKEGLNRRVQKRMKQMSEEKYLNLEERSSDSPFSGWAVMTSSKYDDNTILNASSKVNSITQLKAKYLRSSSEVPTMKQPSEAPCLENVTLTYEESDKSAVQLFKLDSDWNSRKVLYEKKLARQSIPTSILYKYSREMCTSVQFTQQIFEEFKKFLILRQITDKGYKLTMSLLIQLMSDYFVADTEAYSLFTFRSFGRYLGPHRTKESDYGARNYYYTLDVYLQVYGERGPSAIWLSADREILLRRKLKCYNYESYMTGVLKWIKGHLKV